MIQKIFDGFLKIVCNLKKNQRVNKSLLKNKTVKVNFGSALSIAPGWINVDVSPHSFISHYPKIFIKFIYNVTETKTWCPWDRYYDILHNNVFIHHRVEYGLPFPDSSVDYIFTSHMLEHLFKDDAKDFLKEVYRILKPNGMIRICVPDLEYAFSLYKKGEIEKALKLFFVDSRYKYFDQHHYLYDFELLKKYMNKSGLEEVSRCTFKKGMVPDLSILDSRPDETLFVEAIKRQ